jgi:oligopeptide/dipeptide ABC transporter ATP-binding protein
MSDVCERITSDASFIEMRDLNVHFTVRNPDGPKALTLRAVDGIDLDVKRSQCVGIVGESGCGKSTLAKTLMGLVEPTTGAIRVDGDLLGMHRSSASRRRLQMVFQDPGSSLNPRRHVRSTLAELLNHHDLVPDAGMSAALHGLMDMVGLPARVLDARPRDLSGGQRQRVAIARALAVQPDVLVADEAVSALDVSAQAKVVNLLADLRTDLGLTLVFISHDLGVVRALCDRVVVMYLGRIVEDASTDQLFDDPHHPYTKALLEAVPDLGVRREHAQTRRPALDGEPASALDASIGCRFRPRCPVAVPTCATEDPPLLGRPAHRAACVHADPHVAGRHPRREVDV